MTEQRTYPVMVCAYCNRPRPRPDGFPLQIYAQCWSCWWEEHRDLEHGPSVWRRLLDWLRRR